MTKVVKYPTEWAPPRVTKNGKITPPKVMAWDDKKIGFACTMRPTLGSDGATFDVEFGPQYVALVRLINYSPDTPFDVVWQQPEDGMRGDDPQEKIQKLLDGTFGMMQPVFNTRKLKTNVSMWPEQTLVWAFWQPSQMGVLSPNINSSDYKDPDPERQWIRMVFMKPRL